MAIDLTNGYEDLRQHVGHEVEIVTYGDEDNPANVAIECVECQVVLVDFDRPDVERKRQGPDSGVNKIFGKWPIKTTDEDFLNKTREE